MRILTTFLCLVIAIAAHAGQMGGKPPAELAKVNFFMGTWRGTEVFGGMGQPVTVRGTFVGSKILKGRYIQSMHRTSNSPKMPSTEGMHLISYDPAKKHYYAYWFDSEAASGMMMTGNFMGSKLIMTGEAEMEGMGKMKFRATWTPARTTLKFKLEAEMGGKWTTFIDGNYRK